MDNNKKLCHALALVLELAEQNALKEHPGDAARNKEAKRQESAIALVDAHLIKLRTQK